MRAPTSVEPVNDTMFTSVEATRAAGASGPEPVTMLTTPSPSPASATASPSSSTPSGSWGAGLITTVLPAASAGATLPATFTSGML